MLSYPQMCAQSSISVNWLYLRCHLRWDFPSALLDCKQARKIFSTCRGPSHFSGAPEICCDFVAKAEITSLRNTNVGNGRLTNRSPTERSSTRVSRPRPLGLISRLSPLFSSHLTSSWSGGTDQKREDKGEEIFGITEKEKREERRLWFEIVLL